MKKQKNFQVAVIAVLAFAVLAMGVGFATYAQTLNINGTATVSPNKWSVHFKSGSFSKEANSVEVKDIQLTDTSVTFTTALEKVGDYAAFTVDVVNDGTFNALLESITMSDPGEDYIKYTVTYEGTEYSKTTTGLKIGLPYEDNNDHTVLVRVDYVQPTDSSKLPTEETKVTLTASLGYSQTN